MSATDAPAARSARDVGPIQIRSTSLSRQLLGLLFSFLGIQLIDWGLTNNTELTAGVLYAAIGAFVLFNGLYLGGVRFR